MLRDAAEDFDVKDCYYGHLHGTQAHARAEKNSVDGIRYHHIISPQTLYPRNDFLSVTILCTDSGTADALFRHQSL